MNDEKEEAMDENSDMEKAFQKAVDAQVSKSTCHDECCDDFRDGFNAGLAAKSDESVKDENGLLPCPFDGKQAQQAYRSDRGEYVGCMYCNIQTEGYGDPTEAIESWNRRRNENR